MASRDIKAKRELVIEFWGPPSAGKTLLLAALWDELDRDQPGQSPVRDTDAAPRVKTMAYAVGKGGRPERTRQNDEEWVKFTVDGQKGSAVEIRLISRAGELLDAGKSIDSESFARRFDNQLLVVVLNPFLCNGAIAWTALQSLVATLQSDLDEPRTLEWAVVAAFEALFGFDATSDAAKEQSAADKARTSGERLPPTPASDLLALLRKADGLVWRYHRQTTVADHRFEWEGQAKLQDVRMLENVLRREVDSHVRRNRNYLRQVQDAARTLPNAIVVFTRGDLLRLLPAIEQSMIDDLFDAIFFGKPDRYVCQQLLSGVLLNQMTDSGISPWSFRASSVARLQRYIVNLGQIHGRRRSLADWSFLEWTPGGGALPPLA
jgi:hypothetical protein